MVELPPIKLTPNVARVLFAVLHGGSPEISRRRYLWQTMVGGGPSDDDLREVTEWIRRAKDACHNVILEDRRETFAP